MHNYMLPKKDTKGIAGAIVGGVGQVVNAYSLGPANQGTASPPVGLVHHLPEPSVSPGSSLDSKSANPSPAFRPKGRVTGPVRGPVKGGAPPNGGPRPVNDAPCTRCVEMSLVCTIQDPVPSKKAGGKPTVIHVCGPCGKAKAKCSLVPPPLLRKDEE